MRPTKIRISNFRSYESTEWLDIEEKITLVGENNAGKSNLLEAVNVFFAFGSHTSHGQRDFHNKNTEEPIEIDLGFIDLDEGAMETFEPHVFEDELIIRASLPFDTELISADTKQYYAQKEVLRHDDLRGVGSLEPDEAVELYYEYEELLDPFRNDDNWTGKNRASVERLIEAYRSSGEAETKMEWSTLSKSDLKDHAPDFTFFQADRSLDDATRTSNKRSLLFQLLSSAVDEVPEGQTNDIEESLQDIQDQLNGESKFQPIQDLESSLSTKLTKQIRDIGSISIRTRVPDLEKLLIRNVDVYIDDGNQTRIVDMGSGSQMSFVLSCLWELSARNTENSVFALEEPENDLHPHAQRQLYNTINELTAQGHTVFISTHSPELVTLNDIDNVVRVEKRAGISQLYCAEKGSISDVEERKLRTLMTTDKNEMFFSRAVLLCEGPSERQIIPVLNETLSKHNDDVDLFDMRGISVIDVGGKENMGLFAKLAQEYQIPSVGILDDDRGEDDTLDAEHEAIVAEVEELVDSFIHLEEDLEFALFKSLSVEEFCDSMALVSSFDKSPDEIQTAIDESGHPQEIVFKNWFSRFTPSKPQFGRAAVDLIQEDRVPERVGEAIRQTLKVA